MANPFRNCRITSKGQSMKAAKIVCLIGAAGIIAYGLAGAIKTGSPAPLIVAIVAAVLFATL